MYVYTRLGPWLGVGDDATLDSFTLNQNIHNKETVCVTTSLVPTGYRGALLNSLLHVTLYVTHNLLNVLVQIPNKMGLKKIYLKRILLHAPVARQQ
jgi:hypothetical protein